MRTCLVVLLLVSATLAHGAPVVWQVNDPVRPGETAVLFGDGFGVAPKMALSRLADGLAQTPLNTVPAALPSEFMPTVLQATDQCLKVLIPRDQKPGIFTLLVGDQRIRNGVAPVTLNLPTLWWTQIDWGDAGAKSPLLRLFGKSLAGPSAQVYLKGPKTLALPVGKHDDTWASSVALPAGLPGGTYQVFYHSGYGGPLGWSEPTTLVVARPRPWPATVYNVRDFGADGSATRDDTRAIQSALDKAGAAGGGIVLLPCGRYQVTTTLKLPRFTVLRGDAANETSLFWPDLPNPPEALLLGTNSFALENLTIYASNAKHIIVGDQGNVPDAGNVRLWRVRTRVDAYRGHLEPAEVDKRYRDTARLSGGDIVRLGGDNVRITQCDLYGTGRAFYLSRTRNGVVRGNSFYNGRSGWYQIAGSDGLIFENNRITGDDLMATGGGLDCLDGSSYSQNVWFSHNQLALMHGWDREAMTSDAGGGLYYGPIEKAAGMTLTLPDAAKTGGRSWAGAGVFIFSGKGWTQMRRVVKVEDDRVTIDRPWDVPPDSTSLVGITMLQQHYVLEGNSFADAGIAIQFYGSSFEHIVAGNTCARAGGYQGIGKPYGGYQLPPDKNPCHQPSWFCQYVDNEITEGSIYRSGANNSILSGDSVIGIFGWPLTKDWPWPYNVGSVVRRNHLDNNAHLAVGGCGNDRPSVSDAVVEGNVVENAAEGLHLDRAVRGIVVRGNQFGAITTPLAGDGLDRALFAEGQLATAERAQLRSLGKECRGTGDIAAWPELQAPLQALAAASTWGPAARQATSDCTAAFLAGLSKRRLSAPPDSLVRLLGLSLEVDPASTLPTRLQAGGAGIDDLRLNLTFAQPLANCQVKVDVLPPYVATGSGLVPVVDGKAQQLLLVQVPPTAWGRLSLPLQITVTTPQALLTIPRTLTVGTGQIRDWMVLGPLPNKSGQPLDLTLYPPEDALNLQAGVADAQWQPVHLAQPWLDLGKLLNKTPGVAYAVACLNAEKGMPVVLELGSSGGVAVSLNGDYLWSSNQARTAAPAQDRVLLTLRPGDNVLLVKLSTNSNQWRFTAELVPPHDAFAGRITIIPPAQFAGRAALAPPQPRPVAQAGDLRFPSGVNWKLVYADDFTGDALSGRWRQAVGKWTAGAGFLRSGQGQAFLGYAGKLAAPMRIEYDARVMGDTGGDLSASWLADPADYASGYLFGFGSGGNTENKIMVGGDQSQTAARPMVVPGKWHHVIAQILADGRAQLIVDDQLSIDYRGPAPGAPKFPGLWSWGPEGVFTKVRIYQQGE